ncbi:hypothetical protein XENOCAPTIV_006729 [Xenoophorus captivus]|uniref:Glutamate decarboxylase 1 n=1 Tax=Xenoophorus captivus TaxID=1517983 RepID=A0ABV0QCT9_9TELE
MYSVMIARYKYFPEVKTKGMSAAPRLVLFTSEHGYVPLFVNATAGSTVYGAFDPINEIADICEKYNLWLHVDGTVGFEQHIDKCLDLSQYLYNKIKNREGFQMVFNGVVSSSNFLF